MGNLCPGGKKGLIPTERPISLSAVNKQEEFRISLHKAPEATTAFSST